MSAELLYIYAYYNVIWGALALLFFSSLLRHSGYELQANLLDHFLTWVLIVSAIFYIGFRDINIGIDTQNYYDIYSMFSNDDSMFILIDLVFYYPMYLMSHFIDYRIFLLLCAFIYVGFAYWGFYKIFKCYSIFVILLFFISPNFFQFGINVMRHGVAASVFILGLGFMYEKKIKISWILIFLSVGIHLSMILPAIVLWVSKRMHGIGISQGIWMGVLVMKMLGMSAITVLLSSVNIIGDERLSFYITDKAYDSSVAIINYIVYGFSPILAGLYFIHIKKYRDSFYIGLYNVYLINSAFYLFVIDTTFALRFAYLSEFLMPILLVYPLLKVHLWPLRLISISLLYIIIFALKAL